MSDMIEDMSRAIASALGDDYDNAFGDKSEWNEARGQKGGRFRDINEPFWRDYDEAAQAAYAAMMQHLNRELALTELANIEGATDQWLEGFRFAASRLDNV